MQNTIACCHCGHYGSSLIATELDNAPITLPYCMYKSCVKQLAEYELIYLDDMLIYSKT